MLLLSPLRAEAATVELRADPARSAQDDAGTVALYIAGSGERNQLLVSYSAAGVTLSDPGAVVTPGRGCVARDEHTVSCTPPQSSDDVSRELKYTRASLGDLDDELKTTGEAAGSGFPISGVAVNGGPGDDRLFGGPAEDALDGGGGRDELYGGDDTLGDLLSDGDRTGALGDSGPGPDVLDGGPGQHDVVSYHSRTAAVSVDLADPGGDGELGEGDVLAGVESLRGGVGNDLLAGNDLPNRLEGGGGRDRMIGRGAADAITFSSGASVSCGTGRDRILDFDPGDYIEPACELLDGTDSEGTGAVFRAYPMTVRDGGLRWRIDCPDDEFLEPTKCQGTLTLREASGRRRLLGRGEIPRRRRGPVIGVALTPLGRRLADGRQGVRATVRVRGRKLPNAGWTIRLRLSS